MSVPLLRNSNRNSDRKGKENFMVVARVTEISATSPTSFDDAVKHGLERASKTIHNIQSAWISEPNCGRTVDVRQEGG